MPDVTRERRRADRYHDQLCRIAYLVGFYGARAGHTRNPDLADLVRRLDEITREPSPSDPSGRLHRGDQPVPGRDDHR